MIARGERQVSLPDGSVGWVEDNRQKKKSAGKSGACRSSSRDLGVKQVGARHPVLYLHLNGVTVVYPD